ncbi:serine/threonine-protein phosphatase 6 regulatory subunit 3-like [Zingiber officinale]|uniref:serine/threonine-protein phosphatase 6 regulatory subunit 3-like n=1 Tax=Zingiber officinale TaxID=94328 RepID=UPI001C4B1E66|nr:serine/threonine-protein phosphatase 6 regulatory subunit 3-like [Zingiber officinale]
MFWRMTGFTHASPVDSMLEKERFTLEDLLDEDEIIQECKALNTRLINFLREKAQVEKLLHYIVEEPPTDADQKHIFKFPFIASEIFTCEVDIILRTLVEDVELMDLLFSFIKPDRPHSTLLAGYFSKVVICLMIRKTGLFINYIQGHVEIIGQLVDLIGITSIMEVLVRLIGADENMHSNYVEAMQWLEHVDVLDMIVDKFSSSDSPEVHANATEILCAIIRCAPPALATKICSPSYVGRLFCYALEDSRPDSVLYNALSFCICLLDPNRLVASSYQAFRSQLSHGTVVTASQDTVEGMLDRLGDLLRLLNFDSSVGILPTTYGKLQPPLGKQRLKIVEFISVLLTIGSEAVEKELVQLGAIKRVIDLFFEYPFNNFLHHHVENVIGSCLAGRRALIIEHILHDCDIVGKILAAEKQSSLSTDSVKATVCAQGRLPPRIGNIGHITRIGNKLSQLANSNSIIKEHLQENSDWIDWHNFVLHKRNCVENVYQWACGRPTTLHDRVRDSDDDDFRDRDIDVAALASNLSQAFRYGIYGNDDTKEAQGSFERDDEDVYFDDESAEEVISSLRLGDDQESSLFTNSNWFSFENDKEVCDHITDSLPSSSNLDEMPCDADEINEVVLGENKDPSETVSSLQITDVVTTPGEKEATILSNGPVSESIADTSNLDSGQDEKPHEQVECRETLDCEVSDIKPTAHIPSSELEMDKNACLMEGVAVDTDECQSSSGEAETDGQDVDTKSTKAVAGHGGESTDDSGHGELSGSQIVPELSESEAADEVSELKQTTGNLSK